MILVEDVPRALFFVLAGGVTAILVNARYLGIRDALALRRCREQSPTTALIAVATTHGGDAVAAIERGATAFLSWPAPAEVVLQALRSGERRSASS